MRAMDAQLIENARQTLADERDRLRLELSEEVEHPRVAHGAQTAAATEVTESQRGQQLREREEVHLVAIEAALKRIDAGTFGTCSVCGKPIAPERLEALPWATDCIDCHSKKRR
jgi:DnaK suppressor protein